MSNSIQMPGDIAVESITINGLAKDNAGNDVPLRIPRTEPLPAPKTFIRPPGGKYSKMDILEEIPQIPPTISLPSAGLTKAHLCVELGELLTTPIHIRNTIGDSDDDANDYPCQPIADPGAAAVYRVHIQLLDGQPPCPSLVIKIASELEGRNLASEAGMYQALECFQGNAIARMYGYFRAEINLTKLRIKPWSGKEYLGPRGDLDIFRMPNTAASLNIILLEELQPIPSRSLDDAQGREVRTDLLRIAEVLADAGVYYTDWNIANVMRPFPSPQGTHSTGMTDSCLSSDRTYSVRLVDLEHASRTNWSPVLMMRWVKHDSIPLVMNYLLELDPTTDSED